MAKLPLRLDSQSLATVKERMLPSAIPELEEFVSYFQSMGDFPVARLTAVPTTRFIGYASDMSSVDPAGDSYIISACSEGVTMTLEVADPSDANDSCFKEEATESVDYTEKFRTSSFSTKGGEELFERAWNNAAASLLTKLESRRPELERIRGRYLLLKNDAR